MENERRRTVGTERQREERASEPERNVFLRIADKPSAGL